MNGTRAGDTAPVRAAIVASHPIQYQAPWFRALASRADLHVTVVFIGRPDAQQQGKGFDVPFLWDVPLLEGYRWIDAPQVEGPGVLQGFFGARLKNPRGLLRELEPDVLLLTGWHVWPLVQLLRAAKTDNVPVVMRAESNNLRPRRLHARIAHRALLSRCTAFLPIGSASRGFYTGYGVPPARLFDAPYFVDNDRFVQAAGRALAERATLRERWGIPADAMCFCYAGKLEPKKRILDVLDALAQSAGRAARPLHLLVVGSGELMDAAQARAASGRLPVTFAGFLNQSEIASAYVAADALVLPSDYGETWGLVVNEAMACGRAAIVSDRVGCGPDLVAEGRTGGVFPFANTAALAEMFVAWAADPAHVQRMGEAARERVTREFSVERAADATARALHYAASQR